MIVLVVVCVVLCVAIVGFGFLSPARLSLGQEQLLALLHGGIADRDEKTFVDTCVRIHGVTGPQAITRVVRTTDFRDGTAMTVTFSSRPAPTTNQTQCPGS